MESPQTTQTNVVIVLPQITSLLRACDNLEPWLFSKPASGSTFHPASFIMSIIGAIILLFIWTKLVA